eukprot:TRINITY_DN7533_c0_g1_i4.p1 TRINITY_DN7533_c0_g1~~TRINITY_DN7533_c0_g1_i4.p1  ORF type:complete len:195 (-),score=-17.86 TRINITY_DN7533_c0_g1_i4:291-851(-)
MGNITPRTYQIYRTLTKYSSTQQKPNHTIFKFQTHISLKFIKYLKHKTITRRLNQQQFTTKNQSNHLFEILSLQQIQTPQHIFMSPYITEPVWQIYIIFSRADQQILPKILVQLPSYFKGMSYINVVDKKYIFIQAHKLLWQSKCTLTILSPQKLAGPSQHAIICKFWRKKHHLTHLTNFYCNYIF